MNATRLTCASREGELWPREQLADVDRHAVSARDRQPERFFFEIPRHLLEQGLVMLAVPWLVETKELRFTDMRQNQHTPTQQGPALFVDEGGGRDNLVVFEVLPKGIRDRAD